MNYYCSLADDLILIPRYACPSQVITVRSRPDTKIVQSCIRIFYFNVSNLNLAESWQPSWSIRTALTALRSFMATDSPGAIGSTQCSAEIRKEMARKSRWFECSCCGFVFAQLDWVITKITIDLC